MRKYKHMISAFDYSSDLFIEPSLWKGIARVLDILGKFDMYNYSKTEEEADYNALKRDWEIIGKDIFDAIKKYESDIGG